MVYMRWGQAGRTKLQATAPTRDKQRERTCHNTQSLQLLGQPRADMRQLGWPISDPGRQDQRQQAAAGDDCPTQTSQRGHASNSQESSISGSDAAMAPADALGLADCKRDGGELVSDGESCMADRAGCKQFSRSLL